MSRWSLALAASCLLISQANAANVYSFSGGTGNALLTNSAIQISQGNTGITGVSFDNGSGNANCYIQVFDKNAGDVVLGTTIPKMVIPVPAGGYWEEKFVEQGAVQFSTGITMAATATRTGSGACNQSQAGVVEFKS